MQLQQLETKWKHMLTLDFLKDGEHLTPHIERYTARLDEEADGFCESYMGHKNREYPWEDLKTLNRSQTHTDHYLRLRTMATAYAIPSSRYYQSPVISKIVNDVLQFLYDHCYHAGPDTYYDNWWNWEIGNPKALLDIICLMGTALPETLRECYCRTIFHFQPDPRRSGWLSAVLPMRRRTSVGGNRADTSHIAILLGIVWRREELVKEGIHALCETFTMREFQLFAAGEDRDGFYLDGSFIQHGNTPYTGTYGNVLLEGIGLLWYLLADSSYIPSDSGISFIYERIFDTFLPVLYRGHCMDCVCGRGASREVWNHNRTGHGILTSVLWLAQSAPPEYAAPMKSRVKYLIQTDTLRDYVLDADRLFCMGMALDLLKDFGIKPEAPPEETYAFVYMDRLIQHKKSYSAALSLSSRWIRTYETMLGENKLGFYSGDGKLLIYQGDSEEYDGDWQALIDPYALSGTTVIDKVLYPGDGSVCPDTGLVTVMRCDSQTGSAMMDLKRKLGGTTLTGRKSYFFLENSIVALGAGITASGSHAKTIVDTRRMPKRPGHIVRERNFIHITDDAVLATMGYYFPSSDSPIIEHGTRSASWNDINDNGSREMKTRDYVTISISHEHTSSYEYVLLPDSSPGQLRSYAEHPAVTVLLNRSDVQAVSYKNYQLYHCYRAGVYSHFSISQPAALSIKAEGTTSEITLCDPVKTSREPCVLELFGSYRLCESEAEVTIECIDNITRFVIFWQTKKGMPVTITIKEII